MMEMCQHHVEATRLRERGQKWFWTLLLATLIGLIAFSIAIVALILADIHLAARASIFVFTSGTLANACMVKLRRLKRQIVILEKLCAEEQAAKMGEMTTELGAAMTRAFREIFTNHQPKPKSKPEVN